jgi:ATP-dependent DNA helicase DinG
MTKLISIEALEMKLKKQGWINTNSSIIHINQDCVITETYTGKTYSYRVVNYMNGEHKYLFHKRQSIKEDSKAVIEDKLTSFESYGCCYPETGEGLIKFIFEVVFKTFGYSIREEQVELSIQMYQTMINQKISLSDVPVGLGKTHAYLVAAIVQRHFNKVFDLVLRPVMITTSSIELQRAIVKDYLPEISKMLLVFGISKRPITSVIRKGKDNYLCDLRLSNYIQNIDPKKKKVDEIITLRKIKELDEIDLDEIQGVSQYDRKRICVNYNSCQVCLKKNICRYQRFMRNVKKPNIDIQVCNHNYYLADVIRRSKALSALLPEHDVTIIDEAHKLTDAARQMYGSSISQREIYMLAKKAIPKKLKSKESRQLKYLGEELMTYSTLMFKELVNNIPKHIDRDETEKFETVLSSIGRVHLSRIILKIEELIRKMNPAEKRFLADLRRMVKDLKVFQNWGIIYWLEKPFLKGQCVFASIPIALSKELGFDLWRSDGSKILTSGTMAVNDDFGYIESELGIKVAVPGSVEFLSKESPFDYRQNCLLHIPENMPYPSKIDNEYLLKITDEIEKLVKVSNGHAMVLFTSYRPLKIVYENLKHRLSDYEMILMSRGKKDSINKFKQTKNGVLFATGSAWEGVNIPGDLLSHLIVVKLPFPIPDPISEYERTMYSSMEAYIDAVVVPKMLIKLRQGVGRLIRKETDTGVISILDARASSRGKYHDRVIEALPNCKKATQVGEIKHFFARVKSNDFYGK